MNRYGNKVFSPNQFKTADSPQGLLSGTEQSSVQPHVFRKKHWPLAAAGFGLLFLLLWWLF